MSALSYQINKILIYSRDEFFNFNAEMYPSVFYIGTGKTGSQSICSGFVKNKVAHWHSEKFFERTYGANLNQTTLLNIVDYISIKNDKECLIIESFRDPVSRALSVLFQDFHMNRTDPSLSKDKNFVLKWIEKFLDKGYEPYAKNWINHYGIDIRQNFDKNKNYFYTNLSNPKIKLLFLVYENIKNHQDIIRSIGYDFTMSHKNSTSTRSKFSDQYTILKDTIKFSSSKLDKWYSTDYIKSIYSERQIENFKSKYSD